MMSPTPVSHTIVIIMRYDNFANFPLFLTIKYKKNYELHGRGEHCSPVKKCDTYGIFVLFADNKFIIST